MYADMDVFKRQNKPQMKFTEKERHDINQILSSETSRQKAIDRIENLLSTRLSSETAWSGEDDYNKLTGIAAWFLNEDEGDFERPAAEYLLNLRSRLSERKIVLPSEEYQIDF